MLFCALAGWKEKIGFGSVATGKAVMVKLQRVKMLLLPTLTWPHHCQVHQTPLTLWGPVCNAKCLLAICTNSTENPCKTLNWNSEL